MLAQVRARLTFRRILALVLLLAVLATLTIAAVRSDHGATPQGAETSPGRTGQPVTLKTIPAGTNEIVVGTVVSWPGKPDSLDVSERGGLTPLGIAAIIKQASDANLKSTVIHQATLELLGESNNRFLAIPVSVASVDPIAAMDLYGPTVAQALSQGKVVVGERSARLRKAQVGTKFLLAGFTDPLLEVPAEVGAIVPDEQAAGAEMVIAPSVATLLGLQRPQRVAVWGEAVQKNAKEFDRSFGRKYVRKSWTPGSLDSVLSTIEVKETFGEFAMVRRSGSRNGDIEIDPAWQQRNIVRVELPIVGTINCNKKLEEPLREAFQELYDAGIAALIDLDDTRRAGGCFNSREIRTTSGRTGRNLSRHSWGIAIDLNPSASPYGADPQVDARLVDVMRRHGFAWGGTWPFPDGMHFEFIGEPRITGKKLPRGTSTTTSTTSTSTTSTTTTSTTTTSSPSTTSTSTSPTTSTPSTTSTTTVPTPTSVPSTPRPSRADPDAVPVAPPVTSAPLPTEVPVLSTVPPTTLPPATLPPTPTTIPVATLVPPPGGSVPGPPATPGVPPPIA